MAVIVIVHLVRTIDNGRNTGTFFISGHLPTVDKLFPYIIFRTDSRNDRFVQSEQTHFGTQTIGQVEG